MEKDTLIQKIIRAFDSTRLPFPKKKETADFERTERVSSSILVETGEDHRYAFAKKMAETYLAEFKSDPSLVFIDYPNPHRKTEIIKDDEAFDLAIIIRPRIPN